MQPDDLVQAQHLAQLGLDLLARQVRVARRVQQRLLGRDQRPAPRAPTPLSGLPASIQRHNMRSSRERMHPSSVSQDMRHSWARGQSAGCEHVLRVERLPRDDLGGANKRQHSRG